MLNWVRLVRVSVLGLLGILWGVLIPLGFVILYSVLDLQASARTADTASPALAGLQTAEIARAFDANSAAFRRDQQSLVSDAMNLAHARAEFGAKFVKTQQARADVKTASLDALNLGGVSTSLESCSAPPDVLDACQTRNDHQACATDFTKARECYIRAEALLAKQAGQQNASSGSVSLSGLRSTMDAARQDAIDANIAAEAMHGFQQNFDTDTAKATDVENKLVLKGPLADVAQGYESLEALPGFTFLFELPNGVVVALFTSLVASIGAAVTSLVRVQQRPSGFRLSLDDTLVSFAAAPLVGALAGFMTFFVVSAGTNFLTTSDNSGSAGALGNLSAPALAALGIFSGLSAQNAIAWLQAKSDQFFKTNADTQNPINGAQLKRG